MGTPTAVVAGLMMIAATHVQPLPTSGNVMIAVAADETVTITLNGKPITCEELNAYLAMKTKAPHQHAFDCRLLDRKHKP